jgi:hypothetical protein
VRRRLAAIGLLVVAVAAVYFFLIRDKAVAPDVQVPEAVATIGGGEDAVAVTAKGAIVPWFPLAEEPELPALPLSESPQGGRLAGPVLQQARVLGAAPPVLRPYLMSSYYGESGVDVETTSGIELRFGDASQAARKWKVVAAILADPEIEALDYVNVIAPSRPSYGGSGHTLPAPP